MDNIDKILNSIVRIPNEEDFVQKIVDVKYRCINCHYERSIDKSENYFCFCCPRCGRKLTFVYCYNGID